VDEHGRIRPYSDQVWKAVAWHETGAVTYQHDTSGETVTFSLEAVSALGRRPMSIWIIPRNWSHPQARSVA
jgi:hypothetical protein